MCVMFASLAVLFLTCSVIPWISGVKYTPITSKLDGIVFLYPGEARSERDLRNCSMNDVCGVVHKRFWLSPTVERLCRCDDKDKEDCPWNWNEDYTDPYTMYLDSRSQLKFCNKISEVKKCTEREKALEVSDKTQLIATAQCYCPPYNYWALGRHESEVHHNGSMFTNDAYRCKPLPKCTEHQFCGFIRADIFSTYFRCSCPRGDLCLHSTNKKKAEPLNAAELFFYGPALRGYCMPFNTTSALEY
uniref:Uncharacterized protein n=2 Tax=Cacopsylla melanoneura TaxID=428564 RepID=A0A8D8R3T2_9HEMI